MNRRNFLKYCFATGLSFPNIGFSEQHTELKTSQKTLILIELQGGNDGLNTVVPYNDDLYYEYRPNIALERHEIVTLNTELGLHHSLKSLMPLWEQKNIQIVQGVGYQNPAFSHFRSIDIWNTASRSDEFLQSGWLAPSLNSSSTQHAINGLVLGGSHGPLNGSSKTIQINNLKQFLNKSTPAGQTSQNHNFIMNPGLEKILTTQQALDQAANHLKTKLKPLHSPKEFSKHPFGKQMALATQIIQSDLKIPVIKVNLASFDTHANQKPQHARLLKLLSDNIATLANALRQTGHWQQTTLMTYSEFGRRVKENGSKGTDHGTAAPHFIIGGEVNGGLFGHQPDLTNLKNNNLKATTDFRELYQKVMT